MCAEIWVDSIIFAAWPILINVISISDKITFDQVRKAYDMEEDDETGRENFRIKVLDRQLPLSLILNSTDIYFQDSTLTQH